MREVFFKDFQRIKSIDPDLVFVKRNAQTPYGSIDILASKHAKPVAIKIKEGAYQSSSVIGHLHNYARFVAPLGGEVYFAANYVTPQLQEAFAGYTQIHLLTLDGETLHKVNTYTPSRLEKTIEEFTSHPVLQYVKRKLLG